ncbi:MAG: pyrroline-5-carboxylate reductase [Porticoccaceae bacterium]|nr:pyrroline-5-carboxylate reductase [Pseudomonadales bacterium]MCP5173058.1 pyrroline-5-carboxylate reductase [Pseudomonadales bacterium]MCP5302532.1 pyrroline-5-carboxylate reductase [Pseudomonadales bacterium]
MSNTNLAFIGGGNMATSLTGGLIQTGFAPSAITISDPLAENRQRLASKYGVNTTTDNHQAITDASVVILAVKPQILKQVALELAPALIHHPLVISIAAGIPVSALQEWLGDKIPIVRCMPNTPALLRQGATGLFANDLVDEKQKQVAEDILRAVGLAQWVDKEAAIDAVTAVSGSGPAYYFLVMEIMEKVGVELGLEAETARQLTLQTALGAARMALDSDVDTAELRRRVTSPAGTTERAIQSLQNSKLEDIFRQAMKDCVARAEEMAKEMTR